MAEKRRVSVNAAQNGFCGANTEKLLTQSGVEGIEEGAGGKQFCSAIA